MNEETYTEEEEYTEIDGILYPKVHIKGEERMREQPFGRYGSRWIKNLRKNMGAMWLIYFMEGTLVDRVYEIDERAAEMEEALTKQMKKNYGVTEELKAKDMMKWVGLMNNIRHSVDEIIMDTLVYNNMD